MLDSIDGLALFNLVEAVVWFGFGAALLIAALFKPLGFRFGVTAGVAFLFFGASDMVEMRTGAWFEPWWLLVWKAACVLVLAWSYLKYRSLLKSSAAEPAEPPPPKG